MIATRKTVITSSVLRGCVLPIILLCSTLELTTAAAQAQAVPTDDASLTKPNVGRASAGTELVTVPHLELSMVEHPGFGSFAPLPDEAYRSSQATPGLLISMIDHQASDANRRSEAAAQPSADIDRSESFDLYKAMVHDLKTSRYGFLSWTDLKSFARNPADRNLFLSSASLEADARMTDDQPEVQFRPFAQIRLGDYTLPIFLHVTDDQNCCR